MTETKFERLSWTPVAIRSTERGIIADWNGTSAELPAPRVFLSDPDRHAQIATWRLLPGGSLEESEEAELGIRDGYFSADLDDSAWYTSARINDVTYGFPTWEGSAYGGYLWYRSSVRLPVNGDDLELLLGSPLELRDLRWRVWLDGVETPEPTRVEAGLVRIPLGHREPGAEVQVAVQLRIERDWTPDELREREGWQVLDLLCYQMVAPASLLVESPVLGIDIDGNVATIRYEGGVEASVAFDSTDCVLRVRATLAGPAWISHVEFPVRAGGRRTRHDEGAWVLDAHGFQAVAHPSGVTVIRELETTSAVWVGTHAAGLALPEVIVGRDSTADGAETLHAFLAKIGRDAVPYRIYDPYGWYQISHNGEPKSEIDDALLGEIDVMLCSLAEQGIRFDAISVDCGWNDPDDLARFNPQSFPNGTAVLDSLLARHELDLLLWVSPSDGARAFRHELGMVNPGLEAALSENPVMPWRLCTSAEPWRSTFRDALVHLARDSGAKGFKIDAADIWCASEQHDHAPGIYSVFANTTALAETFAAVVDAGAPFLMTYWGLRSPWWLRWAATLWQRDYLVEAAGPSGAASWSLRLGVASSQDIGQQRNWNTIPVHQQDSLGVWISDKIWASHQGKDQWADAFALDLARGSLLTQLWGDLRQLDTVEDIKSLRAIEMGIGRFIEGARRGEPIGRSWADDVYGYRWETIGAELVVLHRPGRGGAITIPTVSEFEGASVIYETPGSRSSAVVEHGAVRISQTGGSVVAYRLDHESREPQVDIVVEPPIDWRQLDSSAGGDVPENLVTTAFLGRAPQIVSYFHGETGPPPPLAEMLPKLNADDRVIEEKYQRWAADIQLGEPAQVAVVSSVSRAGSAWHNDMLHRLITASITVDGSPVDAARWPTFAHQQAGGWSSVVDTLELPAGEHHVEVAVSAALPDTVDLTLQFWAR